EFRERRLPSVTYTLEQISCLGEEAAGKLELAAEHRQEGEVVKRRGRARWVVQLPIDRHRLFVELARPGQIVPPVLDPAGTAQRLRPPGANRGRIGSSEQLVEPLRRLAQTSRQLPEPPERTRRQEAGLQVRCLPRLEGPSHGGP